MKTKKKAGPSSSVSTVVVEEPPVAENQPSNGFKKDRFNLSFDLNADGSPDFENMQERTKTRVREFLLDEKMRATFGAKPAEIPAVQVVHPAAVQGLYFTLGTIESMLVPWFAKEIKPEIARQVFVYNERELAILTPPTVAVLNKYADWFLKYQDEIALVTLLSSITMQKVQACILLSRGNIQVPTEPKKEETPTAPN